MMRKVREEDRKMGSIEALSIVPVLVKSYNYCFFYLSDIFPHSPSTLMFSSYLFFPVDFFQLLFLNQLFFPSYVFFS